MNKQPLAYPAKLGPCSNQGKGFGSSSRRPISGQASVEFIIVSMFVLVPIIMGAAYLAKVVDVRHKSIEAARYAAWERTVWHETGNTHNIKTSEQIQSEIVRRIFSDASHVFDSEQDLNGGTVENTPLNPFHMLPGIDGDGQKRLLLEIAYKSENASMDMTWPDGDAEVVGLNLNKNLLSHSGLTVTVAPLPKWGLNEKIEMAAVKNVIVNDDWNARGAYSETGSIEDRVSQVKPLHDFPNPLSEFANAASGFDDAPFVEWNEFHPQWVDSDSVPCERIVGGNARYGSSC